MIINGVTIDVTFAEATFSIMRYFYHEQVNLLK